MKDYIWRRVLDVADHINRTGDTVRQTAKVFGVSKSTIHKDVADRLPRIDRQLAKQVRQILEKNKAERHLRGGEATKAKYLQENIS